MKRLALVVALLLVPAIASAFDTARQPLRVAVLRSAAEWESGPDADVRRAITRSFCEELRARGLEAWESDATYDDALESGVEGADFVVEFIGARGESDDWAGVGVGGRHLDVTLGVVASRVAADVRIYDAPTMELIATDTLARNATALLPTGVGIGGADIFGFIAVPIAQRAQVRRISRSVARDAATVVASAIRAE